MGFSWAPYYSLARTNNIGPETKNWAVTDTNWYTTSLLLKRFEGHHHNAATPMRFPGYNILNPATPATPLLTLAPTGGSIAAGTSIGIRLSFIDQYGLETEASPEQAIQTPPVVIRPNPINVLAPVSTPVPGALPGGSYIYAITKRLQTGESAISDVTTVDVPFNANATTSYAVPLTFDSINSYTDSTDSLCIYRTSGYDTNFVLLTTITATPGRQNNTTSYTDDGSVQDASHQPPQTSEFGKQSLLTIDWSKLSIPSSAYRFRVYLTQQVGIWGTQNLFQDYLLVNPATPFPGFITYQGTEVLGTGYPFDYGQIPYGAPLVNLSTEAVGAPIYTQPANAAGWQTWNLVLPDQNHATPVFGAIYVDGTVGGNGQLKVCLSTPNGPNGPGLFTTLAAVGSGYAHPIRESGGHVAANIPSGSGTSVATVGDLFSLVGNANVANSTNVPAAWRKAVNNIYKVAATPMDLQNSVSATNQYMADMDTAIQWPSGISPSFAGQWFEFNFDNNAYAVAGGLSGQYVSYILEINGQALAETTRSVGASFLTGGQSMYMSRPINFATPLTRSNNRFRIIWSLSFPGYAVSLGNGPAGPAERTFIIKEIF